MAMAEQPGSVLIAARSARNCLERICDLLEQMPQPPGVAERLQGELDQIHSDLRRVRWYVEALNPGY